MSRAGIRRIKTNNLLYVSRLKFLLDSVEIPKEIIDFVLMPNLTTLLLDYNVEVSRAAHAITHSSN